MSCQLLIDIQHKYGQHLERMERYEKYFLISEISLRCWIDILQAWKDADLKSVREISQRIQDEIAEETDVTALLKVLVNNL